MCSKIPLITIVLFTMHWSENLILLFALHFLLFWITNILRIKYQGFAPVYQNSLVFTIKMGQIVDQVTLLINNIPMKRQHLTSMFNIRYGGLRNQQVG